MVPEASGTSEEGLRQGMPTEVQANNDQCGLPRGLEERSLKSYDKLKCFEKLPGQVKKYIKKTIKAICCPPLNKYMFFLFLNNLYLFISLPIFQ
ncbi:hypothetical protein B9Z55_022652 [Caenorhabditis nigoni]|uniref:Uncharacterized protein n=1 Tax=Caenorhabditis nigoni TaxID=1611254 RepID=A0A2G5SLW5_9PELO|nr:hypothetical protein B9Z55_022652 [Caenorhabditis nigoni]